MTPKIKISEISNSFDSFFTWISSFEKRRFSFNFVSKKEINSSYSVLTSCWLFLWLLEVVVLELLEVVLLLLLLLLLFVLFVGEVPFVVFPI